METYYDAASIFDMRTARSDPFFRAWLTVFFDSAARLTGVNPDKDMTLGPKLRRWFLKGLEPYDAVKRWQRFGMR